MKKAFLTTLAALLAFSIQPLTAQLPNEGMAARIISARKANAALMQQYTWQSRTELIDNGETVDTRIDQVTYGPDGQLQHTLLNDDSSKKMPRGFLRKAIAEKKKEDVKKYLEGLRKVLDQYTLPTAGKVLDFLDQANIQAPDSNGLLQMTGNNVVSPGDQLIISTEAATRQTRKVEINTFYEGDAVTATATFKTLSSGLNHVEYAEIDIPAKSIKLLIQNYNYQNQNN